MLARWDGASWGGSVCQSGCRNLVAYFGVILVDGRASDFEHRRRPHGTLFGLVRWGFEDKELRRFKGSEITLCGWYSSWDV